MSFRTTCPHCGSVFRVGAPQLEAAAGWAQCGVCGGAFDARTSLLLEDGSPLPRPPEPEPAAAPAAAPAAIEPDHAEPEAAPTTTEPVEPVAPPESIESTEPAESSAPAEPERAESPAPEPGSPAPAWTPVGIAQREAAPDLTSIIIIDPDIPVSDDYGPMPEIRATSASDTSGLPLMYPPPYVRAPTALGAGTGVATPPAVCRIEAPRTQPAADESRSEPAPRRGRSWAWALAGVLLLAALLGQAAYFLRDTLVSQLPQSRPLLERMCALAGCTLSLPKNLALLQIVGSDLETEAKGRYRLTLTLGNRAGHAQAWPVLVLTLTDQRNRPLTRRSFAPSEYLGDAGRIAAGMPPRSEQPLSLPLTVHDIRPMGFDLQLVY